MAVRVNDRHLSDIEYENTYGKLNDYIASKIRRLPKRYGHFLGEPFNAVMNEIYRDIIRLTSLYFTGKTKSVERYRLCAEILNSFEEVIRLSYTYWNLSDNQKNNIKYVDAKARKFWATFVNKEIALIIGVMSKCNADKKIPITAPTMSFRSKREINDVVFLSKLSELEKIIYKRAIHTCKDFRDARMEMLVSLSRSALYNAIQGNDVFVNGDEKLYNKRRKFFSDAVGDLYAMNRPLKELGFNDIFSEKELESICVLLTECIRIIKSVQETDSELFMKQ